jgi:hypothetical protein
VAVSVGVAVPVSVGVGVDVSVGVGVDVSVGVGVDVSVGVGVDVSVGVGVDVSVGLGELEVSDGDGEPELDEVDGDGDADLLADAAAVGLAMLDGGGLRNADSDGPWPIDGRTCFGCAVPVGLTTAAACDGAAAEVAAGLACGVSRF